MSKVEQSIKNSITKNGFPQKKVNLPFKAIFEFCKRENEKLSDVLERLKNEGIMSQIGNDKILFYVEADTAGADQQKMSQNFYQQAMEQLKNMDPNQLAELKQKVMNMSPEEREALMKKAQDFMGPSN